MRLPSLRLRLIAVAGVSLATALLIAWGGLTFLFERHVERRYAEQLGIHAQSLIARLAVGPDGRLKLSRPLSEPRFEQPLSGLYWTIEDVASGRTLRSRSLWDRDLAAVAGGEAATTTRAGGNLVVQRRVRLAGADRAAVIQVAMDAGQITSARVEFSRELALSLALLGLVLALAAWVQIELGLRPLDRLRAAADALDADPRSRLAAGDFPTEVMPLVAAINRLLDARARSVQAARTRAGDLAHALKSPLSVLRNQAGRLERDGQVEAGATLKAALVAMDRQVDRELSRARAALSAESGPAACDPRALAEQLIRVVSRTAEGEGRAWENRIPEGLSVPLSTDDLAEVLGPVLDNAARHAAGRVRIGWREPMGIVVDDDGAGMEAERRAAAVRRGVRFDERGDGAGLGLAIASEILAARAWRLELDVSDMGGLRVVLEPDDAPG